MPHVWFPEGVPGEFPAFYVCRSGDVSIFKRLLSREGEYSTAGKKWQVFFTGVGLGFNGKGNGGFTTTKSDKTEGESHSPLLVRGNGDIYNYSERWEMYDR
jgi:hypothetical protein